MSSVAILDYGIGNIRSMYNAVEQIGENAVVTSDKNKVLASKALIIPGVGSFNTGMKNLFEMDVIETIEKYIDTGKTVLGICLGMQLLVRKGYEGGERDGLGLIEGSVREVEIDISESTKLPHVGWNSLGGIKDRERNIIFKDIPKDAKFYFVHSYSVCDISKDNVLCITRYGGIDIVAGIQRENVIGFQFHPEKSATDGLKLLGNVIK